MDISNSNNTTLIYRSQTSDDALRSILVHTRRCNVKYYIEHELSAFEEFICSYLSNIPDNCIPIKDLGYNLGFDIVDNPDKRSFYDEAEDHLFIMMLDEPQGWGLIEISNEWVKLTQLGMIALSKKKKYAFYSAAVDLLEWNKLKDASGEKITLYPFWNELGLSAHYLTPQKLSYSDEYVSFVKELPQDDFVQEVQLQTAEKYILFEANYAKIPYFGVATTKLDVDLLQASDGAYSLLFYHEGNECTNLNHLYSESINQEEKDLKVEMALYTKLMNDKNAVLNFQSLSPFKDILEIEKIIPDNRVDWNDSKIFELIAESCNADNWHSLSRCCNIPALEQNVEKYKEKLDWSILTLRLSEEFIISHYKDYSWETQLLSARKPTSQSLIKFILLHYEFENGKDDGLWDWEEIIPILDYEFIRDNITTIPFDLSAYTRELSDVQRSIIVDYPDASWDWLYITMGFPVEFLLNNISRIASYLNLGSLLDRLFTDPETIELAIDSKGLLDSIKSNHDNLVNVYSPNNKKYIWSDSVIDFFEQGLLLQWNSTQYRKGFAQNHSLIWNQDFFLKHHNNVSNQDDCFYIAANITDNSVIDAVPTFDWNWNILSRNKVVYDDPDFVIAHSSQINIPAIILNCSSSLIEQYFNPLNIGNIMLDDAAVQAKVTDSVSIDFIKSNISCNWDWRKVTRRVYDSIKIDVIGRELWRDKWDWDFLSQSLPINDILDYAKAYSEKWNWNYILCRVDIDALIVSGKWDEIFEILAEKEHSETEWNYLSNNLPIDYILQNSQYIYFWNWKHVLNRLNEDYLLKENIINRLQKILATVDDADSLWEIITNKFQTANLIDIIKKYSDTIYHWNYADLYSRSDFDAKKYLDEQCGYIKWEYFSASEGVNKLFAKAKNKKTRSLWLRIFKDYLENESYKWNFSLLSHLPNILQEPRLFQLDKNWDWDYISEHAKWISFAEGDNYFVNRFKDSLNFQLLSPRTDINLSEKDISKYEKKGYKWDWDALTQNTSINYSLKFIADHIGKPWNWKLLSSHPALNTKFIEDHKDKEWDWKLITTREFFEPNVDILLYILQLGIVPAWSVISRNSNITLDVIAHFASEIDWSILIRDNSNFLEIASELVKFINRFESYIKWDDLNDRIGNNISSELIDAYPEKINWRNASQSQLINFEVDFVKHYIGQWYWGELIRNIKFQRDIPAYKVIFKNQVKINTFIERLQTQVSTPYIYHFTHFYNAIEVIRTKKILSRNRAQELGLLRFDSAGSVVLRSSLAHPYARFYFRPCTPTQYYNEALGADSKLGKYGSRPVYDEFGNKYWVDVFKSKYPKALNLGLPKCPVPVFFRFDIEEVLSTMPDSCFYSDRNMQSNNPHVYKVIENAESLCVDYLYDTMERAKARAKCGGGWDETEINNYMKYSQQEFLVKSEFDFSSIESLKIICYDDQYTNILRGIFADDPICQKIYSVYELNEYGLFEKENRSVSLNTQMDTSTMSTDFMDDYYFNIKSSDLSFVKFDFSYADVLYENPSKEIHVRGKIKWTNTTVPFEIYFYDPKARTKEWLIYNNSTNTSHDSAKFKMDKDVQSWVDCFKDSLVNIPIELKTGLFYPNMVNSYHGIAHTARVLFATHLLAYAINLNDDERNACYVAAIIHDLGKRSDREGAEHGYNSMIRFKERIYELIESNSLANRILQSVQYHSVADKDCPSTVQNDIIWKVLKDADALDRSRFVGNGCDKSFLRLGVYDTPIGQNIIDLTTYLPSWTQGSDWSNPYDTIIGQIENYTC